MGSQAIATYMTEVMQGGSGSPPPMDDVDAMSVATQMYQTAVSAQCSNKHEVYVQTEEWGEYTFSGLTVGTRRYEVRLWTLLQIVFVVSGLFQTWRYFYWQSSYRPVGPDFTRWLEYMLTSPLQIFIIGMSVMVRDVSMLTTLAFLQGALVMLGYLLELAIQSYVDYMRNKYFAAILKKQKGLAKRNSLISKEPQFSLKGETASTFPNSNTEETTYLLNLLGIFLDQESDPDNEEEEDTAGKVRAKNMRMWIIYRVSVVFLFSWCILGVIFTLLFTRLARQGDIIRDCPQPGETANPGGIPAIVWGILATQCFLFASFGINASVLWVRLWMTAYSERNCCPADNKDNPQNTPLISSSNTSTSIMNIVYESDLVVYKTWMQHTLVYSILNLMCKSLLEILLFVYAAMVLSFTGTTHNS